MADEGMSVQLANLAFVEERGGEADAGMGVGHGKPLGWCGI